ncbi:MAG: DUF2577 domain-containing protein [Bacillota bacterium]|nr:DUF2577 domain-containing protein [Bacillota bacterium]
MVQLIKKAAVEAVDNSMPAGVFFGEVTSTAPLKINVEQKMTLTENNLVLTSMVSDFDVKMTVNQIEEAYSVRLGLSVGEKVILIRSQGGQKFIVLDRVR